MTSAHKSNDVAGTMDGILSMLLALRLRQIESEYSSYGEFAAKTGLSKGTLYKLRIEESNPTFHTVERLAKSLGISVWGLLGISEAGIREGLAAHGLCYEEINEHLEAKMRSRRNITSFKGVSTRR